MIPFLAATVERIRKVFQRTPPPPPAALTGEVAVADPDRLTFYTAGGGDLNPSKLVTRKGLEVFDDMKRDPQIKAALALRTKAALATGWQVKSPEGKDTLDEKGEIEKKWEVTEFVEWCLSTYLGKQAVPFRSIEDILASVLRGRKVYGYSVAEKVYEEIDEGPWKGKLGLAKLETRKPHEIEFKADEFGNLEKILQRGSLSAHLTELPPFKFVVSVNEFEWGNFYGTSELDAAYRPWWAKDNSYKWYMLALQKLGVPPLFFFYDPDAIPAKMKNQIKTILERLQAGTSAMIPSKGGEQGARLETLGQILGKMAGDTFKVALDQWDGWISRALLMPGLLGLSPEGKFGQRALGETQFDVFLLVVEDDRTDLQTNVMDGQVIRQLVDVNFGPQEEYPYFELNPLQEQDKLAILTAWKEQLGVGAVKKQETDEEHIRRLLEFPEIQEGREEEEVPPPVPPGMPGQQPPEPPTPAGGEDEDEDEGEDGGADLPTQNALRSFALSRSTTTFEEAAGGAKHFASVEKAIQGQEEVGMDFAADALETTLASVIRAVERKGDEIDDAFIRSVSLPGRRPFEAAIRNMLRNLFDAGRENLRQEVGRTVAARFQDKGPTFIPREALRFLNTKSITLAGDTYGELEKAVRTVLRSKLELGLTVRETVQRLRDAFEPFVAPGGLPAHRLEAIARTESTSAFNMGRLVEARDADIVEFMTGMQYSAILDSRVTEVCKHLDDKVFRMSDPDLDKLKPPNHVNCRSILVPVTIAQEVPEGQFITEKQKAIAKSVDDPKEKRSAQKGFV